MAANPAFHSLLDRMREMHDRKNSDYSRGSENPYSNFEEAAAAAGVTVDEVFAVLMGIKQARIRQLTQSGREVLNEPLADSYLDLAVYAALRASYPLWQQEP
jgi:hypothetical protein